MIKITKNLLNHYFLPLLKEVLTDTAEGKKNPYLRKLLIAESLTVLEKTNFMNDYFQTRPSYLQYLGNASEEDRRMFREEFLAQLAHGLKNRLMLSGFEGLKKAYLPDKDQKFDFEKQRNVYLLGYNMALGFEKKEIQKLIQQRSESGTITLDQSQKDQQLLQKDELKLFEIKGEWQYLPEDQLKIIASSPQYSTLPVSPYLSADFSYTSGEEQSVEVPNQQELTAISSQGEFIALGEMRKLLNESKLAKLEMILSERGLNVIGHLLIDDLGIVTGKVSDPDGKIYEIRIDTSKGIDPKNLPITYALPKGTNKEAESEKKKEKIRVDFSKLDLKAKPAKDEKPAEEAIVLPDKAQGMPLLPSQEEAKPAVFVLPQRSQKVVAPSKKVAKPIPTKPKISILQQKMAREAKPAVGKKAAPPVKRPPNPAPFAPPATSKKPAVPGTKAPKNPMERFAKWGTFGTIVGFVGASGVIVFSKFF